MKEKRRERVLAGLLCLAFSFCLCLSGERSLHEPDIHGRMPLQHAIRTGSFEKVQTLIRQGAPVNSRGRDGLTPLMVAAQKNKHKEIQLLCRSNAFLERKTDDSFHTAAWFAVTGGCVEALETLLKNGANVDAACDSSERTLLTDAIYFGKQASIKILCDYGANINAKDRNGRSVVDYALGLFEVTGDLSAYIFLKKKGATITDEQLSKIKMIENCLLQGDL